MTSDVVEKLNDSRELSEAAKELEEKEKEQLRKLRLEDLSEFAIKGSEEEWASVLVGKQKGGDKLRK